MDHKKHSVYDAEFWKISIGLGLASLVIFSYLYSVHPLLPVFVKVFNLSVSMASLALSITIIGLIVGLIVWGLLSDRYGRRLFINGSLIGAFLPMVLIPLCESYGLIIGLRFIQGVAISGLPAAAIAYIGEEIRRKDIKIAIALYITSNAVGGMLGRALASIVTEHYSWQTAFYALGITGAILSLFIIIILPKSQYFYRSEVSVIEDIKAFAYHLKNPTLLMLFGLGITLQLSFTGMWTYLPFYLEKPPFSMNLQTVAYFFFAYSFGIIGAPIASFLANRFGITAIRALGIICMTLGMLLALSSLVSIIAFGLCLACFGFFTAHALTAASVNEEAAHHKGTATSLYFVAYYIGVAGGSTALAPLWESYHWLGIILFTSLVPLGYLLFLRRN